MRSTLLLWAAAIMAALALSSEAQAWGCRHVGYTHVGPSGVYHYGHTSAVGPYGAYSGGHAGAYGYGGASYHAGYGGGYHAGYAGYGGYHYGSSAYGGYHYGGYGMAADPYAYRAGVYRYY